MEKPVQWMSMQELRDELERTRPAWEAMDVVLADGQFHALSEDAQRHRQVAKELMRRPSESGSPASGEG
jgi:hypothetical protein